MFIVLARDPNEPAWTILHQGENADDALDYWRGQPEDASQRLCIDTSNFITFDLSADEVD